MMKSLSKIIFISNLLIGSFAKLGILFKVKASPPAGGSKPQYISIFKEFNRPITPTLGKRPVLQSLLILFLVVFLSSPATAQEEWVQDFRNLMVIDQVMEIESSPAHKYVLSGEEGLVVFRTNADTLQWLYSSEGMEKRGHTLQADVRFAYLYGDSRRLTIVEPTSVLGVYSSTVLPDTPRSVQRLGNFIYLALGEYGVGRLSLESPESVDHEPEFIIPSIFENSRVLDLVSDGNSTLFVLKANQTLEILERSSNDPELRAARSIELEAPVRRLFLTENELLGTTQNGEIYYIGSDGRTTRAGSVQEPVDKLRLWHGDLVVRTLSGKLWADKASGGLTLWKESEQGGVFFTIVNEKLWISENNQISPVLRIDTREDESTADGNLFPEQTPGPPELKPVESITFPFPRPLLQPIVLNSGHRADQIELTYRSDIHNAKLRGQTFYWQPTATQIGRHEVTILATTSSGLTDSTRFSIDLRPFNTPPRFTPVRPMTINIEEEFTFDIRAIDPDGKNPELIRYLGVDLPAGARLEEKAGRFTWTPTIRQVGNFEFQVIATDQYGAASQQNIKIRVIETDPNAEAEIE
ncbi:MAG: putative Ig domain-containing protein [Balneolaceae bacterium]